MSFIDLKFLFTTSKSCLNFYFKKKSKKLNNYMFTYCDDSG